MKINVTANINPKLIANRVPQANHILALQAQKDMEPFVPFLNGALRNNTIVSENKIIYKSPYAHYQYVGDVYVDPKTGLAGIPGKDGWFSRKGVTKVPTGRPLQHKTGQDHWDKAAKAQNMGKWLRVYKKAVTGGD